MKSKMCVGAPIGAVNTRVNRSPGLRARGDPHARPPAAAVRGRHARATNQQLGLFTKSDSFILAFTKNTPPTLNSKPLNPKTLHPKPLTPYFRLIYSIFFG